MIPLLNWGEGVMGLDALLDITKAFKAESTDSVASTVSGILRRTTGQSRF